MRVLHRRGEAVQGPPAGEAGKRVYERVSRASAMPRVMIMAVSTGQAVAGVSAKETVDIVSSVLLWRGGARRVVTLLKWPSRTPADAPSGKIFGR